MAIVSTLTVDAYVADVLMRDLVGHDRSPSAFLVYLHLTYQCARQQKRAVRMSYQEIAESTGVSKTAVQRGVRCLERRRLVTIRKDSATATPEYRVLRPWRR